MVATLAPHSHSLCSGTSCVRCSAGVTGDSGTLKSQQRYLPFGGERTLPTPPNSPITNTDYGYTGQRELDPGMGGLMDYRARFFSPHLGRFFQPDSIVPNMANPQDLNRYSYVNNGPINSNDPTGHDLVDKIKKNKKNYGKHWKQYAKGWNRDGSLPERGSDKDDLVKYIESTYSVDLDGPWTVRGLRQLRFTLDAYANVLGGASRLNYWFEQVSSDRVTFLLDPTNDKNIKAACNGRGHACWNNKDTVEMDAYSLTSEYFNTYFSGGGTTRPKSLGLANRNSSIQITIGHEIAHLLVDGNPKALDTFAKISSWQPSGQTFFYSNVKDCTGACLYEENMATSFSIYVVSGGKDYPGHTDLTETASTIFSSYFKYCSFAKIRG